MGVSKNRGTPKSSIFIGFSIINHPFWGTPIFGNTHILRPEKSNNMPQPQPEGGMLVRLHMIYLNFCCNSMVSHQVLAEKSSGHTLGVGQMLQFV